MWHFTWHCPVDQRKQVHILSDDLCNLCSMSKESSCCYPTKKWLLDRNAWNPITMQTIIIIIIIIIPLRVSFSHQLTLVVIDWSLSDSNSSWLSKSLLNILTKLNNAVICMVLILSLISNSSRTISKAMRQFKVHQLQLVSSLPLFFFLCYLSIFSLSFSISTLWSAETAKSARLQSSVSFEVKKMKQLITS